MMPPRKRVRVIVKKNNPHTVENILLHLEFK